MVDLLIRNALIVDGSGNPGYYGDLAVEGDRIAGIGRFSHAGAATVIDAMGKVLCPGFIDVHSHSELEMLAGRHTAGIQMGVTTEFSGPDGMCYIPLPPERMREYRRYVYALYGDADVGWDWQTLDEYLARFHRCSRNNLALQAPHGVIRLAVKGWAPGPATDEEIAAMRRLVREWMEAGAVGLNAGLEYLPGALSDTRELVELSKVVAEYRGIFAAHMRGYTDDRRDAAVAEMVTVAEQAEVGIHIQHFSGTAETYASAEAARARGIDLTWDAYPYAAGSTMLAYTLPSSLATADFDGLIAKLRQPAVRQQVGEEAKRWFFEGSPPYFASVSQPQNRWMAGLPVWKAAQKSGKSLGDFVCDLLIEEDLAPLLVFPWTDGAEANEARVRHSLTHPLQMVITDGIYVGSHPHPRGWGTYPRMLAWAVREKGWLRLEEAIRKMTGFPAMRFGLHDRGLLRKGLAADLVIFDPKTVQDRATYELPRQPPVGIEYVFVNGEMVVDRGAITDKMPGRVLSMRR